MDDDEDDDGDVDDQLIHHRRPSPSKLKFPKATAFKSSETVCEFSVAVLGSVLYVVGGYSDHSKVVRKYDLSAASLGKDIVEQTISPEMQCARRCPLVLPLKGKLFIFGGFRIGEGPWGEIYDPCDHKWSPLDPPQGDYFPEMSYGSPFPDYVAFWATMGSKIVFGSYLLAGNLVLYTLVEGDANWNWTEEITTPMHHIPISPGSLIWREHAVAIGHTLLWFEPATCIFVAFDMIRKVWYDEKLNGIIDPLPCHLVDLCPRLDLLHEGDVGEASTVCLLFMQSIGKPKEKFSLLHCVKMNVWIDPNEELIVSQMLGCQCMTSDVWFEASHKFLG